MAHTHTNNNRHTDGHRHLETESAQWAVSVKSTNHKHAVKINTYHKSAALLTLIVHGLGHPEKYKNSSSQG